MKLIATGDFHFGAGADYGRRPGDRLTDQERVWDSIVDLALEGRVNAVLIAGDVFHRPRPAPDVLMAFARPLRRLIGAGIEVVAITGNAGHDIENADRPCALDLFDTAIRVYRRPDVFAFGLPGEPLVEIAFLPNQPVHRLVATQDGGDRDELNDQAAALVIEIAHGLRARMRDDSMKLLLGHWSATSAVTSTGVDVGVFREPVLPLGQIAALGFDAVVLGHIHKPQVLDGVGDPRVGFVGLPAVFYVGSPAAVDFGEAEQCHGVMLIDTGERVVEFVPSDDRPFVTLDYDLVQSGANPVEALIAQDFDQVPVDGAVVRIRYRATEDQARKIDHTKLRTAMLQAGAHHVYAIQPEIVRETRARAEGLDEAAEPLEAFARFLEALHIPEDRRPALLDRTARYLEGMAA